MARNEDQERAKVPNKEGPAVLGPNEFGPVAAIVMKAVGADGSDRAAPERDLYGEILALARFVEAVKQEVAALGPDRAEGRRLPMAADELAFIVDATETATHQICAAAESIEALSPQMTSDLGSQVTAEVTRIYEACSFQDLTGQRIAKVVAALQHVEAKMHDLLRAFGDTSVGPARPSPQGQRPDRHLMQGPQAPGEAKSQDEIDALLASLE